VAPRSADDDSWDVARLLGTPIHAVGLSELLRGIEVVIETHDLNEGDIRIYAEAPRGGVSFVAHADGLVSTIQLHSDGHEGYDGYQGTMPAGLRFSDDRRAVRGRLGEPSGSGEPRSVPGLGPMPAWDRFDRPHAVLHVEYLPSGPGLRLVTVMTEVP
jgi:hypothetical protein